MLDSHKSTRIQQSDQQNHHDSDTQTQILNDLWQDNDRLLEELKETKTQLYLWKDQLSEIQSQYNHLYQNHIIAQNNNNDLSHKLNEFKNMYNNLQMHYNDLVKKFDMKKAELNLLDEQFTESLFHKNDLKTLKKKLRKEEKLHLQQMREYWDKIRKLKDDKHNLQSKQTRLLKDILNYKQQSEYHENTCKSLKMQNKFLSNKQKAYKTQIKNIQTKMSKANIDLRQKKLEHKKLHNDLKNHERSVDTLKHFITEKNIYPNYIHPYHKSLYDTISNLKQKYQKIEFHYMELSDTYKILKTKHENLQKVQTNTEKSLNICRNVMQTYNQKLTQTKKDNTYLQLKLQKIHMDNTYTIELSTSISYIKNTIGKNFVKYICDSLFEKTDANYHKCLMMDDIIDFTFFTACISKTGNLKECSIITNFLINKHLSTLISKLVDGDTCAKFVSNAFVAAPFFTNNPITGMLVLATHASDTTKNYLQITDPQNEEESGIYTYINPIALGLALTVGGTLYINGGVGLVSIAYAMGTTYNIADLTSTLIENTETLVSYLYNDVMQGNYPEDNNLSGENNNPDSDDFY